MALEKDTAQQLDHPSGEREKDVDSDPEDIVFNDAETKRLLRKVDYRLLPVLTLLYLMSFLDRSNSRYHVLSSTHPLLLTMCSSRQCQSCRSRRLTWAE